MQRLERASLRRRQLAGIAIDVDPGCILALKPLRAVGIEHRQHDDGERVGEAVASRAMEQGIKRVVFDRGGYRYHGKVKELADAARAKGLEF